MTLTDRELLHLAAQTLTDNEHQAWQLAHKGMSQRTIAHALNISRSTVRSRLENATRKLRLAEKENAA